MQTGGEKLASRTQPQNYPLKGVRLANFSPPRSADPPPLSQDLYSGVEFQAVSSRKLPTLLAFRLKFVAGTPRTSPSTGQKSQKSTQGGRVGENKGADLDENLQTVKKKRSFYFFRKRAQTKIINTFYFYYLRKFKS